MGRRFRTVKLYVAGELMSAFLVAFAFFFFIFFVNQLLLMAERILAKRVPLGDVALLVLYSIPIIVTYALPFGTLVGALMAVGRLASDREIMALRAAGVALRTIFAPLLVVSAILAVLAFGFNDLLLPMGNIALKTMLRRVIFQNPAVELSPYSVNRYGKTVIVTGKVLGNRIAPIVIIDESEDNTKRVITAREAELLESNRQTGALSLRMTGVFDHVARAADRGDYEYSSADSMVYNILLQDISVALVNPGPAEKSSVDVWTEIGEMRVRVAEREEERAEQARRVRFELASRLRRALVLADQGGGGVPTAEWDALSRLLADLKRVEDQPVFDRTLQSYLLEFHRKFATPFACLAFVVFAFPVGLLARRSGRMIGFGVGIVMSGLYWAMLIVSFRFGSRSTFSPVLSMWIPNVVVLAAGAALLVVRARK